jgi:hypothetical protein
MIAAVPRLNRRTTPRVRDGRVQKKHSWRPARGDYWAVAPGAIQLDRRRPAERHRHVVTIAHLRTFLPLLPNWDEAAIGLRAVLLDSATDCYGWYGPGVVALCNWEHDLWDWWDPAEIDEHRDLLDLLCVERVPVEESREYGEFASWFEQRMGEPPGQRGLLELRWTEAQARAFLMLYTLPHELGHHHDRLTNRSRTRLARGEPYAHAYAERALERLWPIYARHFDL